MPIRTNRGRAAVYRRLWAWPLRSPNHLAATIIGIAVVVIVFSSVIPAMVKGTKGGSATNGAATTSSQASGQVGVIPTGVPTISLPSKAPAPSSDPPSAAPDPDALLTAENWAEAFITRPADNSNATWLETLKPYTTEEELPVLKTVDPRNLPNALDGEVKLKASHADSVVYEIGLKGGAGGTLQMTLVKRNEKWLVHKYDRG
ncbi:MAG: hypothetical protein ABIQ18_15525 [Umezawaea sp.]